MRWYRNLYVGSLIKSRRTRVVDDINHGVYPAFVYLLILPESTGSQLEIIRASELSHAYIRGHCLQIVGLAQGRTEAESLLEALVQDVYRDRKDADIRAWLSQTN